MPNLPGEESVPGIRALFSPERPHSPWGSVTPASPGESSSQSASSAVPSRLLLNCFPPFTFQVPTATWIRLKCVNSDWRSDMARRTLGVTERRQRRAQLSASTPRGSPQNTNGDSVSTGRNGGGGLVLRIRAVVRRQAMQAINCVTGTRPCGVFAIDA